jgi:Na+/proline symporter/signal transduction histidine kinase
MNFDIDLIIVLAFLTLTLFVGLGHGKSVRTIKDYALGGRNFTTGALVATIVATWASGSGFFITLSETYSNGFYDSFATVGIGVAFLIVSFILVPRMGEFLGKISIAEAMGDLYGSKVRFVTAAAGTIGAAGLIAVQFKAFGSVVSYFIGITPTVAIIISGVIATVYSAFGGIRAVTFTDILQGFAFGVIIPLLGFAIWNQFYHGGYSLEVALSDPKFNLELLFDSSSNNFWNFIFLFIYFSIPPLSAALFQRISMGSSIKQVKKAFLIASIIFILITFATTWIPFLIHAINPHIEPSQLLGYIVDTFSFTGLKGLIIVAIIAFAMSTADSMINSASVLFTHDIYGVLAENRENELFVTKLFACILGFGTIILSLVETDLLGIVIFANSFYFPLVVPPFLLTIFGFRSSGKSVLIGMIIGLIVTILWKLLPSGFLPVSQNVIGVLFAMLCNTIFLFGSHYILRQTGGWVGIQDTTYLNEQKSKKALERINFDKWITNYNFRNFCHKLAPHNEIAYTTLGVYFIVCTITTMYSTQVELLGSNAELMKIIYPLMLVTGTTIAMYQIWPLSIATRIKRTIIETWYPIAIFYMLIFFACFFVLVSKFAMLQVALFIANLMIAALLLGWRLALPAIIAGFYTAIIFYQYFFGVTGFVVKLGSPEFILIYAVLFIGTSVIFFIKPKEERQEETNAKLGTLESEVIHLDHEVTNLHGKVVDLNDTVAHYSERISDQEKEIERLGATAQKILNNVNHELRLPVGNVMNFAEMLNEGLGKFSPEQLKMLSDEVYKNSNRLSSMIMNMLDLAALNAGKLELDKKVINLGELVEDRVRNCRKIYLEDKKIDFIIEAHPEIFIAVDPNYMRQIVDNLVINAIKFSEEGKINIQLLRKDNDLIEFTIEDKGIGIPQNEIYDIFTPFKMGSNTESKAEGRGIGLALCKAAIEAHGGMISVESKGVGAIFRFVLKNTK